MGFLWGITCRNKECRYHIEVREGPSMRRFAQIKKLEHDILSGVKESSEEVQNLLRKGNVIKCVATYECHTCREWQVGYYPYILEMTSVSPYGTIRSYQLHYLGDMPKCTVCNSELSLIFNPRSSKNKCHRCGAENMKVNCVGCYD